MILETERLILRPLELRDAPTIRQLANDYEIAANTLNIPHPYPEGAAEAFIQSTFEGFQNGTRFSFAIVRRAEDAPLGGIGMHPDFDHQHAEIGYWLGKAYWNQGYVTEAARRLIDFGFADLGLHRIYASYFSHNLASRRVMEKAGMTYEGTLRQHIQRFGAFHDLGQCGILRSEWEARRS